MKLFDKDRWLVARAQKGDRESLAALVDRHLRPAFRLAYALTGSAAESDDLVQEAFLRAFQDLGRIEGGRFGPWLGGIVRHLAADRRRGEFRRARLEERLAGRLDGAQQEVPEDAMDRSEAERVVNEEIAGLPEELRTPVVLFYFEGQSSRLVAERLGLCPAAVRKRLQLARDRLRPRLRGRLERALGALVPSPLLKAKILAAAPPVSPALPSSLLATASSGLLPAALGGLLMGTKVKVFVLLPALFLITAGGFIAVGRFFPMSKKETPRQEMPTVADQGAIPARKGAGGLHATKDEQSPDREVEPSLSLAGIVLDPDGRHAPGAIVSAYPLARNGSIRYVPPGEIPSASTDPDGKFDLGEPGEGKWAVAARSGAGWALVPSVDLPGVPLVIHLERGNRPEGRVMDEKEMPIPGAMIQVACAYGSDRPRFPPNPISEESDAEGKFLLPCLPAGTYQIEAKAFAHWPDTRRVDVPLVDSLDFRLRPATFVAGRAFLRDLSHPLVKATIDILETRANGFGGSPAETDAEGRFIQDPMLSGKHSLTFRHGDFCPVMIEVVLTEAAPRDDLEVVFLDGITARGVVRNQEGVALAGAVLTWERREAPLAARLTCMADLRGRFERRGLEPGDYHVFLDGSAERRHQEAEVTVSEEIEQETNLIFDVPPSIWIEVRDSRGRPAAQAPVNIHLKTKKMSMNRDGGQFTGDDGRFAIAGLLREGTLEVKAGNSEIGEGIATTDLGPAMDLIVVNLQGSGKLSGKVVDGHGEPVARALVRWVPQQTVSSIGPSEERADGRGEFQAVLPQGTYEVVASSGSVGAGRLQGVTIESEKETQIKIVIAPEGTIRGRVLGPDGKALSGIVISIRKDPSRRRSQDTFLTTDDTGCFAAFLDDAEYAVRAEDNDHLALALIEGVRPGGLPLEIRVDPSPGGRVWGTVEEDGSPVAGASVTYFLLDESHFASEPPRTTDAKGIFDFPRVVGDRIVAVAWSSRFAYARSEEIRVLPRDVVDVKVTPVPGRDLELRLKDPEGNPVPGAGVRIEGGMVPPVKAEGWADASGIFRLKRLPPGEYRIEGHATAGDLGSVQKVTWNGDEGAVELILMRGR